MSDFDVQSTWLPPGLATFTAGRGWGVAIPPSSEQFRSGMKRAEYADGARSWTYWLAHALAELLEGRGTTTDMLGRG